MTSTASPPTPPTCAALQIKNKNGNKPGQLLAAIKSNECSAGAGAKGAALRTPSDHTFLPLLLLHPPPSLHSPPTSALLANNNLHRFQQKHRVKHLEHGNSSLVYYFFLLHN